MTAPGSDTAPDRLAGVAAFSRALVRDFGGYLVSLGLLSLGSLLLLPLIIAFLTPAETGLYSLVEVALVQGVTISLLGLKFSYLYYYAQVDADRRPRLLGTALVLTVGTALLTGTALAAVFGHAGLMARFDAAPLSHAWLLVPLLLSGAVQTVLLTELRAARHVWLSAVIGGAQLVLLLGLSTAAVAWLDLGLTGLLAAQAIAQTLSCIAAFVVLRRRIRAGFEPAWAGRLLRYGVPMMLGLMLRYSLDTLSRFLLAALVSIEAAGDFLVVSRILLLFEGLLALPFFTAWGGLMHHALRRPEAAAIVGRATTLALAAGAALGLTMLALQPLLFAQLARDPRADLAGVFALLLLARVVQLVKSPLTTGILRTGETRWSVTNNLLALGVFLVLIWPAASRYGLTGMAAAMLVATTAAAASLTVAAWRHCPHRIDWPALALGALLLAAAALLVWGGPASLPLAAAFVAAAALPVALLWRHLRVMDSR